MIQRQLKEVPFSRSDYDAFIFDMDGVLTRTARVHAAAWKALFDEYRERTAGTWKPFDPDEDYRRYVDGKPRYDGIRSFLASRGIEIPFGTPEDDREKETICGLGNRKNAFFREHLRKQGVETYGPAVDLVRKLRTAGFGTAVISASRNCERVLREAGLLDLFDVRVDGVVSEKIGLKGKPDPDIFLEAARRLGTDPGRSVVVEDALAGIEAGKKGRFGCVIAVDRTGHPESLRDAGADLVVADLSEIALAEKVLPSALESLGDIEEAVSGKETVVFLDYDGTLTPIVESPDLAVLSPDMRRKVKNLADVCTVGVISGRDLQDVRSMVGIDGIVYAGSHGFDIAGPGGRRTELQQGKDFLPALDEAEKQLREILRPVEGTLVERKKFSIAVHYRKVRQEEVPQVEDRVDRVLEQSSGLRKSFGKKVFELQPEIDWNKGKALFWVLDALDLDGPDVLPFYIGDDTTDEDAFTAIEDRGIGIVVMNRPRPTRARYALKDPDAVGRFLESLERVIRR